MSKLAIYSIGVFFYVFAILPGVCAWDGGREEATFIVDPSLSLAEKEAILSEQEAIFCRENSVRKVTEKYAIEDGNRHILGVKIKYKKY